MRPAPATEGAARQLAELLAERGDQAGLQCGRADAGDWEAGERLAELLAKRDDLDEAEQILRARVDAGDPFAASGVADLLAQRGDLDEAEQYAWTRQRRR